MIKPTFWQQSLESMLTNLSLGEISVTFPNKEIKTFIGKKQGPVANVQFLTDRAIKNTILGGSLGFCEAVISGEIISTEMHKIIEIGGYQESGLNTSGRGYYLSKLINKVFHFLNRNSITGSKKKYSSSL